MIKHTLNIVEMINTETVTYIGSLLVPGESRGDDRGHARDDGLLVGRLAAPAALFPLLLLTKVCTDGRGHVGAQNMKEIKEIKGGGK